MQAVTKRSEFSSGVRAQLPMLLAVFPFGLILARLRAMRGSRRWLRLPLPR